MEPFCVAALYHFTTLENPASLREAIHRACEERGVKGTLILADEGINGTIAAPPDSMRDFLSWLRQLPSFARLEHKESTATTPPFRRLKVKVKPEIVTFGVPSIDPLTDAGTYVTPSDWNALISDPDTIVIDTRNDFEARIGTFRGAVNPHTTSFREFPAFVDENLDPSEHRKVAMFCTGGIRCEKATAFLKHKGFENVFHLRGGILKYLEEIPEEESLWEGECFVFDDRVTVGHGLKEGTFGQCFACKTPLASHDMMHEDYHPGVSCPHCKGKLTPEQWNRVNERQRQHELARLRTSGE